MIKSLFRLVLVFIIFFIHTNSGLTISDIDTTSTLNHKDWILSIAISPNGKLIASAGRDNVIKIWDLYSKEEIKTLYGHSDWVGSIEFSNDGNYILSGSWDKTIRLWDVETGIELKRFYDTEGITCVSFSPDGNLFLTTGYGNIKIWDLSEEKIVQILEGHQGYVQSAKFSKDGKFIVSGGFDGMVKLWEITTGEEIHNFIGHINFVHSVDFSPDGTKIISGGMDKTVKIWDVQNKSFIKSLRGHSGWVLTTIYTKDGKYIISGTTDKNIYVWDSETFQLVNKISAHNNWVSYLAISPDNLYLASSSCDKTIKIWETKKWKRILTLGEKNAPTVSTVSKNGRLLACNDENNHINIWDITEGKKISTLKGHNHIITALSFSPDDNYLLSGSIESLIKVWDIKTKELTKIIPGNSTGITSINFSSDGKYLLISGIDGIITLWDWEESKIIQQYYVSNDRFTVSYFSTDGKYIAISGSDGTISIWDIEKNEIIFSEKVHNKEIYSLAFSPKESLIISGGNDNKLKLLDFINKKELKIFEGHLGAIKGVVFSSDGSKVISISTDKTIKIWDIFSGDLVKNIKTDLNLTSISLFENILIVGAKGNIVKMWSIDPFREIATIYNLKNREWLFLTSNGFYNSSCSGDNYFIIKHNDKNFFLNQFRFNLCKSKIVKEILMNKNTQIDYKITPLLAPEPPEIKIDSNEKFLKVYLKSQKQLKNVKIYEDGLLVHKKKLNNLLEYSYEIEEKFISNTKSKSNKIQKNKIIEIFASNDSSESEEVRFIQVDDNTSDTPSNLWILSLGLSYLQNKSLSKLYFSSRDALAITKLFKNSGKKIFNKINSFVINDITKRNSIHKELSEAINNTKNQISPNDIFIFYISGYAISDEKNSYLVVSDSKTDEKNYSADTLINLKKIIKELNFKSKKIIILDSYDLDSTYYYFRKFDGTNLINYAKKNNFAMLISSNNSEMACASEKFGHSFLVYSIIEGLLMKADKNNDEKVSLDELESFLNYKICDISDCYEKLCIILPQSYRKIILSEN